jgi:hypothetical protein
MKLVDDAAEEHRLPSARIGLYLQQLTARFLLPLLEGSVIKNLAVRVC